MFIKDMLSEELRNSLQIKKDYEQALRELPKGAIVRKLIAGRPYYYLAHRAGLKVRFDYLGKISDKEAKKHAEIKQRRARYRQRISEINRQIRFLRKVLREKQSI